jgi:hypothetical protein
MHFVQQSSTLGRLDRENCDRQEIIMARERPCFPKTRVRLPVSFHLHS